MAQNLAANRFCSVNIFLQVRLPAIFTARTFIAPSCFRSWLPWKTHVITCKGRSNCEEVQTVWRRAVLDHAASAAFSVTSEPLTLRPRHTAAMFQRFVLLSPQLRARLRHAAIVLDRPAFVRFQRSSCLS